MLKECLPVIVGHPVEAGKTAINLFKEVLDFEPRPGSDKGYEPEFNLKTVIERTVEKIEGKKQSQNHCVFCRKRKNLTPKVVLIDKRVCTFNT